MLAYSEAERRLHGRAAATARLFRAQELEHERTILGAIVGLGSKPTPARPPSMYASGFPPLRSRQDVLRFAVDIENTQISAYGDSIGTVFTPELRATLLTIVTVEAEHMSVLLGELGEPQASQALVTGSAPT